MRVRSRDLIALAEETAKTAAEIATSIGPALDRSLDWLPSPISNGMGPSTSGGDHSSLDNKVIDPKADEHDPNISGLKRGPDRMTVWVQAMTADAKQMAVIAGRLKATIARFDVLTRAEAERLANEADTSKSKQCVNPSCRAWISGIGADRARGGRCDACRKYRERRESEGFPLEDRPHRLVHRIPLQGCTDCDRVHREVTA